MIANNMIIDGTIDVIAIASMTFYWWASNIESQNNTGPAWPSLSHNLSRPSKPNNYPQRLYLYKRLSRGNEDRFGLLTKIFFFLRSQRITVFRNCLGWRPLPSLTLSAREHVGIVVWLKIFLIDYTNFLFLKVGVYRVFLFPENTCFWLAIRKIHLRYSFPGLWRWSRWFFGNVDSCGRLYGVV